MASGNERQLRTGRTGKNERARRGEKDPQDLGRFEMAAEPRSPGRTRAGGGNRHNAQGPSGAKSVGRKAAGRSSSQGESTRKTGSSLKRYGTGGGKASYGRKR